MKKTSFFWLALFTLGAFLLRIWGAGALPAILNRDEAALGYNAFLLMETGMDEWSRPWPLGLESFGDYKLLGYPALLIPFLRIFGLHDWVVRFPSVLAGTALVPLLYFLSLRFGLKRDSALIAAFLASISPVFVWYSRLAFEANVALSLTVGALLLLLGLQNRFSWIRLLGSGALLTAAMFTYNTPLILLPVFAVLPLFFQKRSLSQKAAVILLLAGIAVIGAWLLLPISAQKSGITVFTDETVRSHWAAFRSSLPPIWQSIIGSRFLYWAGIIGTHFIQSFSPVFLVFKGGSHPWHTVPGSGHLLGIAYILSLTGLLVSLKEIFSSPGKKESRFSACMLILLLFASLLPSVVTVDSPHATRSLLFFVLLTVLAAKGFLFLTEAWFVGNKKWLNKLLIVGLLLQGIIFAHRLFFEFPHRQNAYQPGFDRVIQETEQNFPQTPVAIVDSAGYHYILLAWYLRLPADEYFSSISRQLPDHIGFRYGERLSHYHFIATESDRAENELLLIQWMPEEARWSVEQF